MQRKRTRSAGKSRPGVQIGAIVAVTAVAVGLAIYARQLARELPPLTVEELTAFRLDPYLVGYLFQSVIVPLVLIYLFSNTPVFRRVVTGRPAANDHLKLFGGLLVIQLIVLSYDLVRSLRGEPPQAVLGLVVLITAGLLGGWRTGLGLGLVVMLFRGTQLFVMHTPGAFYDELGWIYQAEGLGGLLVMPNWPRILFDTYLANLWAISAVWAGLVAGFAGELLGERRFVPLAALVLGISIDLGAGYLAAIAGATPGVLFLVADVLVTGIAMVAVALMVRNVQAAVARRETEAAELALARAELRALQAQINPHFLFNSLNTIRYFVRTDPEIARRLLLDLSEVFQRALRSGESVPLADELSYVEAYLSLEQARLGERLRVEWSLPRGLAGIGDSILGEQPVPTLILQPIVENAVVHGISKTSEGGTLRIDVGTAGGDLVLRVTDNGPGISAERLAAVLAPLAEDGPVPREGRVSIGLRNVDGRLRALYGEEYGLVVDSQPGRGTAVELRIPSKE